MIGRLPKPLSDVRERGEQNVALAMDEQDLSRRAMSQVADLFKVIGYCVPGEVGQSLQRRCRDIYQTVQQQLEIDREDEANGREMNRDVTVLIKEREPLKRTALTQTATV